jgi:hypothetical protein
MVSHCCPSFIPMPVARRWRSMRAHLRRAAVHAPDRQTTTDEAVDRVLFGISNAT